MRIIGITGGIGSGKTQVCSYLEEKYGAVVLTADDIAHKVTKPGTSCIRQLHQFFGREYFLPDGSMDRKKIGTVAFASPILLERLNSIIHPAVYDEIKKHLRIAEAEGKNLVLIEAALLIGTAYRDLCDEFWYVYAREDVRIRRLQEGRSISEERARSVMKRQLSEAEFRRGCDYLLDNSGTFMQTAEEIDKRLAEESIK